VEQVALLFASQVVQALSRLCQSLLNPVDLPSGREGITFTGDLFELRLWLFLTHRRHLLPPRPPQPRRLVADASEARSTSSQHQFRTLHPLF
jgi:hypothetical protein